MISFSKHKDLIFFISLNYFDKAISFALPLFVLFFVGEISLYNNIEYIYSIANVGVVLAELGGRNYMLYAYSKESEQDRDAFLSQVKNYFSLLTLFYVAILVFSLFLVNVTALVSIFIPFIGVRIIILLFTNYYSIYYRLIDKPQYILYYSIAMNMLTILFLIIGYKFIAKGSGLTVYFFVQIVFVVLLFLLSVKKMRLISFGLAMSYLKKSLIFSWPIILNVLLVTFINNFGKIYIFNRFSEQDMYAFSYLLRISMVVQMAHASIVAYYSKRLFLDESKQIDRRLYWFYSAFLLVSAILSILIVIVINALEIIPSITVGFTSCILLLYVFLWCQQSFLEQYLNKINKNKWILYVSFIGVLVYLFMIFVPFREVTVGYIALSMLCSTLVALSILVAYFKYKRML